ncbi:MAG: hypothetical protein ACSLFF_05495, partial [Solirubrobacterales bacterium]
TTGANPLSLSGLTNGTTYTYIARVQDAAGNNSAASNSVTWTVDTAAPAAPTLTRTSPTSTPTSSTTATLTAGNVEAGGIVQYSSNGGTTWTTGTNPLSLSGLTNGTTYTYIARVQDAAGNNSAASNSVTWTVDTAAPAAPTLTRTSPTSTPTNQTTAQLNAGNIEAGGQLQCSTDGTATWNNCSTPINLSGLTEGTYGYHARVRDAAGNNSPASTPVTWQVDLTAPGLPTVSTPPDSSLSTATITFSGPEAGVTYRCSLNSAAATVCTSPVNLSGLANGPQTFTVQAVDAAGNIGSAQTVTWTIGSVTPLPNTLIGDAPAATPVLTPTIPVSTANGTSYQCQVDDAPAAWASCDPNTGTYDASIVFTDYATNKVEIRAVNSTGPDATPVTTHLWVSTAAVTAHATVSAADNRAGAHTDVSGTITLNGGYNAKTVKLDLPLGFNGALAATSEKCDASGGDPEAMDCPATAPGSAIGTIDGVGVASTTGTITDATSTIYLTTPPADFTSPAGVWVDVKSPSHPELGHIRAFGWVNIVQVDSGSINGDVRQSITIPALPERTSTGVRFHVNSLSLSLMGDPPGGTFPLTTNPTTCDPHSFEGSGTTWAEDGLGGNGPDVPQTFVDYPVTDCGTLEFNPVLDQEFFMTNPIDGSTFDPLDPAASLVSVGKNLDTNLVDLRAGVAGTIATVTNGVPSTTARKAAIRSTTVLQPQGTGANFAALSGSGTTCPGSAATADGIFDQSQCLPQAQIGTASINTPLLDQPLEGTVWAINNTPLPWIGIYISPDSGPNNPAGVYLSLTARTDLTCADTAPSCTDATYKRVTLTLENMPDVPFDLVTLDLSGRTARPLDIFNNPLPTQILAMPDAGSVGCLPSDNIYATTISGPGVVSNALLPTTMSHCAFGAVAPTLTKTAPTGSVTNQTTATFNLVNNDTNGATLVCRLNNEPWAPCSGTQTLTGLTDRLNTFSARAVTPDGTDGSNVANVNWTVDTVPPGMTLTKGAANSGNVTFAWTRTQAGGTFTCRKDAAPSYTTAQCSPSIVSGGLLSGTQTWASVVAGSGSHTFSVRITDAAGNETIRSVTWTA